MKKLRIPVIIITGLMALQGTWSRGPKIKTVINLRSHNAQVEYTYMTSGYVLEMRNSHGYSTLFTYTDTLVARKLSNQNGVDTFILGPNGLARESIGFDNICFKFTYDADGFLVLSESTTRNFTLGAERYTIAGGNIASVLNLSLKNHPKGRTVYTYYADKLNTIGNANLGIGFLGRSSKNLVKESVTLGAEGDTLRHLLYYYHFNREGRVSQKVVYNTGGQLEDSTGYIYNGQGE